MASKPMTGLDDKGHFVGWLQQQNGAEAQYALIRHFNAPLPNTGKPSNMSGHFHSGFLAFAPTSGPIRNIKEHCSARAGSQLYGPTTRI